MRTTLNTGWDSEIMLQGIGACLILGLLMYALAVNALRLRTRRN
jgi:hypothetical protein